ncbi:MAG: DUF4097 family beta strand repeat protein [Bdellovibrionaceae bacterium]|nr:DUF4097 family beta strand repeat protein [Pseudobdellovibrionaceae bacterium]
MKQNTFLKIFFGLLVFTMVSYSIAGYSIRRAKIENPGVVSTVAKHYNMQYQDDGNNISFTTLNDQGNYVKSQKTWDLDGAQTKIKIATKSADVFIEKSPDEKFHFIAEGMLRSENSPPDLFEMKVEKNEVEIKETRTKETKLHIQVPKSAQEFSFKSVSGNLEAHQIAGKEFEVATVSGDAHLAEISVKELGIVTVSGDLQITSKIPSDIQIGSTSGNVKIQTAEAAQTDIKLKTVSGQITNPFKTSSKSNRKIEVTTVSGAIEIL